MKLSEKCSEVNFSSCGDKASSSINLDSLYCSHLWSNSKLRKSIIATPVVDNKSVKYCYTCRGKIRKYEVRSYDNSFIPNNYSTPNKAITEQTIKNATDSKDEAQVKFKAITLYPSSPLNDLDSENTTDIPTISRKIDSELCQKFTSYETQFTESNQRRFRNNTNGIGYLTNFSSVYRPSKKRKKIQACSISVMIIAILVISFILVNITTPHLANSIKVNSTITVPNNNTIDYNETSSAIINTNVPKVTKTESPRTTTMELLALYASKNTSLSGVMSNIRKNIKTYPKNSNKSHENSKPKEISYRDISQKFCSCQIDDICMLDENSGKSICRPPIDKSDPTGCGGLCALETEACQLVDKMRGVRVCRSLSSITCSPNEWQCRNGFCVPAEARCDGTIECYDRSDEMFCECDLSEEFRCGHSISCFPNYKLCDGIVDCWDAYDEVNCTIECGQKQFTCKDGECIIFSKFCDGRLDCFDGSDEPQGCEICGPHEKRCKNNRCVPKILFCDGQDNCDEPSDEKKC